MSDGTMRRKKCEVCGKNFYTMDHALTSCQSCPTKVAMLAASAVVVPPVVEPPAPKKRAPRKAAATPELPVEPETPVNDEPTPGEPEAPVPETSETEATS